MPPSLIQHSLSRRVATPLAMAFLWFCLPVRSQETQANLMVDISLEATAPRDDRVQLIELPSGSKDRVEYAADGLRIAQGSETGSKCQSAGFSLRLPAKSTFSLLLELDVARLDQPKKIWHQGMWIRVLPENPAEPVAALGYIATPTMTGAIGVSERHRDDPKLVVQTQPFHFQKGTWLIERKENQLILAISENGAGFHEVQRLPCSTSPVRGFEVWCTRQQVGNVPAEYLFRRIRFVGDEYYAQPPPRVPLFTLARVVKTLWWLAVISLVGLVAYRQTVQPESQLRRWLQRMQY